MNAAHGHAVAVARDVRRYLTDGLVRVFAALRSGRCSTAERAQADHAILLETPPEVLSGSTRMGAATAQKIALNMLSTLMAVELGHIHDGMMVNLHADNIKLRQRAANIVTEIAGVAQEVAQSALEAAQGDVKTAVLVAARGMTPAAAQIALKDTHGRLRDALENSK